MGLDAIELVLEFEDKFQIVITDKEAEKADAVGKVVDLIYSRLRKDVRESCPSQHGFYIVRKQLISQLGLSRSVIKPNVELATLIAEQNRSNAWREIVSSLAGDRTFAPALVRPQWANRLAFQAAPLIVFIAVLFLLPFKFSWVGFIAAITATTLCGLATAPLSNEFPPEFKKVKDLIKFVNTLDNKTWTKEQVFNKVREISVDVLGVKPEEVTLEAHWVHDLKVG